jgi:hypothetical protein
LLDLRFQRRAQEIAAAWAREAANFHITFMICEQWPRWTTMDRIREHGMASGYRFQITAFEVSPRAARISRVEHGRRPDLL